MAPRRDTIATVDSDAFVLGRGTVLSNVWVLPSAATAAHDVAAWGSRRALACFRGERNGEGAAAASWSRIRSPLGVGSGLRVAARVPLGGRHIRVVADQFVFNTGPVEVLVTFSAVSHLPDARVERRVFASLYKRAGQSVP